MLYIFLNNFLKIFSIHFSIFLSLNLSVYLSIFFSLNVSKYFAIYKYYSIYPSLNLAIYIYIYLSICYSIYLSKYLSKIFLAHSRLSNLVPLPSQSAFSLLVHYPYAGYLLVQYFALSLSHYTSPPILCSCLSAI